VCNTQDGVGGRAVTTAPAAAAYATAILLSIGDVTIQCGTVAADICEPSTDRRYYYFSYSNNCPSTNGLIAL